MKAKKPLTIKQKKNRARATQFALFCGEFLSVATPFAIMAGVNHQEWFINNPEPWKLGLGGALGLALMSLAVLLVSKIKEDKSITGGYVALVVGWYAVAFIFLLLARIMNEIYTIMFYGGFGLLGAFGLDIGSKHFKKQADDYKEAIESAKKEINKDKAKYEINLDDYYSDEEIKKLKKEKTNKVKF